MFKKKEKKIQFNIIIFLMMVIMCGLSNSASCSQKPNNDPVQQHYDWLYKLAEREFLKDQHLIFDPEIESRYKNDISKMRKRSCWRTFLSYFLPD